jgi:DNA polymerase elongation subunit (family B)
LFVDAKLIKGRVYVSSYDETGERKVTTHMPPYVFYHNDRFGNHTSIYHDKVKEKRYTNREKFKTELAKKSASEVFESDVNPVFRLLEEKFPNNDTPPLKISILDIECDKDPARGWSNVSSPYALINAITIYNKWEDQYYTLSVAPPNMTRQEAIDLLADNADDDFGSMTEDNGYFVCEDEGQLLELSLEIIADADVLTGWNSGFFDIPYMIQRVRLTLGGESLHTIEKEGEKTATGDNSNGRYGQDVIPFEPSKESIPWLKQFCLKEFDCLPEMKMVERYGKDEKSFTIFGRVHLDYLELYRKFTFEELHSYTLDAILEREVQQNKLTYEGSLDQLYRNDFRTFIAYNRQDVAGLAAMDAKLKMVELANTMTHLAGVTFDKVFGSVAIIEQAILRELHKQDMVCFDKNIKDAKHEKVPGAFVVDPRKGLYDWIASFDINSLYPSVIRCLNISPECVIGQFDLSQTEDKIADLQTKGMEYTEAWGQLTGAMEYHFIADGTDDLVTLCVEKADLLSNTNGITQVTATGKEWKQQLRDANWSLSANGTVFDLSREGIVPYCLTKWYKQRQDWQAEKKKRKKAQADATGDELAKLKEEEAYYDMIQMVMKIFLNSTYGALLNRFCRFYDPRLGKSVTLTGRVITKHMLEVANAKIESRVKGDT